MIAMAKTHPHIEHPTDEQLLAAVPDRPDTIRETYVALHHLVTETLPDVSCSLDLVDAAIGYGERQYGYSGWGMAAVTPFASWVAVTLLSGARLPDPDRLLEGSAATMRHVRVRSLDHLADVRDGLAALLRAAATLNTA